MEKIRMSSDAYKYLYETVGQYPPETGAVIGQEGDCITRYWFDETANVGMPFYRPSCDAIEHVVNGWIRQGYRFAGIVHSHIEQYPQLSPMDLRSAMLIMEANNMNSILMGLFCRGILTMYMLRKTGVGEHPNLVPVEVVIV